MPHRTMRIRYNGHKSTVLADGTYNGVVCPICRNSDPVIIKKGQNEIRYCCNVCGELWNRIIKWKDQTISYNWKERY